MKIEVLYVADCPSHPVAVKLVSRVLAAEGVSADVREVLVEDESMAKELRFSGSPTIRIDGRDVVGETEAPSNFSLSCRLYGGSQMAALPPAEAIRRAVAEARQRGEA